MYKKIIFKNYASRDFGSKKTGMKLIIAALCEYL